MDDLLGGPKVTKGGFADVQRTWNRQSAGPEPDKRVEFDTVVPLLPCGIERLVANRTSNFGPCAVGAASKHNRAGIHGVITEIGRAHV